MNTTIEKRQAIGTIISPKRAPLRIHINQHNIRSNKQHGTDLPVVTIKRGSENFYANGVKTLGEATIVYSGAGCDVNPILSCGARVVMETHGDVLITH